MAFFYQWLIYASVNIAAILSPGPAFAFTVRSAIAYGRRAGILTALGLGLGVGVHVALVMGGMALIISKSLILFNVLKYCGAAYLCFIGIKAIRARKTLQTRVQRNDSTVDYKSISDAKAIGAGFLTNLLNPKAIVFFTAVLSQFITPNMPSGGMIIYAITSITAEAIWFSIVALILTDRRVKEKFFSISHCIERICGGLMIALGLRLALSRHLMR